MVHVRPRSRKVKWAGEIRVSILSDLCGQAREKFCTDLERGFHIGFEHGFIGMVADTAGLRRKSMAVGTRAAITIASWPAPLGMRLMANPAG